MANNVQDLNIEYGGGTGVMPVLFMGHRNPDTDMTGLLKQTKR
jgi:hypothetical protein